MVLIRRNGQFFIIGALLIASLITGYVILDIGSIHTPQTQTPRDLFDRAVAEFPVMLNQVMAEDPAPDQMQRRLTTYLAFQRDTSTAHGVRPRSYALVGVPHQDNITFVFSNFDGQPLKHVRLTVDGTTKTRSTVADGTTHQFSFSTVPNHVPVRLSFGAGTPVNRTFTASRSRVSALFYLQLDGQDQTWQGTRIY